jgi:pimeloyl-ACP methyl ester carboxylesterase
MPLDWNNQSDSRMAAVAVIKLPAMVPVNDPRYGGPVLLNPGGPGGSGVSLALRRAKLLQTIIDAPKTQLKEDSNNSSGLYFDVVGFDPRGVNNTTPGATCFPSAFARQIYGVAKEAQGIIQDNNSFTGVYNRIQAVSQTCSNVLSHDGEYSSDVGRFMTTPVVVEDMIEITERLAEWREKEAHILQKRSCKNSMQAALDRSKWQKGKELVQYIGFSYGTILGATLATMHPSRVKRIILDGVADSDDYYAGTWLTNLQDTDEIMTRFFEECHRVGRHKCAIYSATGAQGSQELLENVLEGLRVTPIPVTATRSLAPDLITYSDLMALIRDALYKPRELFKQLADVVSALSVGNGTLLAERKQKEYKPFCPTSECEKGGPWSNTCHSNGAGLSMEESSSALIHCTDAPDWTGTDLDFHREKWATLKNQSRWLGDYWSEITTACANMWMRPAWRFEGEKKQQVGGNTSHPILFMSNSRDPVTPLRK